MVRLYTVGLSICLACGLSADIVAQETGEPEVRQSIAAYVDAFNSQQFDKVAGFWAESGVHVDRETGERTEGRQAIVEDIEQFFSEEPDAVLGGAVSEVRMIKPDVASIDGESSLALPDREPIRSSFSAILVKRGDQWQLESMEEMALAEPPTPYDALQDLEWLVGSWLDESEMGRVETEVRWSAGQAFLIRSFRAGDADGDAREGTQVIGWDPRALQIRSWTFNSDGSFGSGVWSQSGEDWLIQSSQTLADGRAASGTFVLTRINDDEISLQLVGHTIEGDPQPSSEAVTVTRVEDLSADEAATASLDDN